MKRDLRSALPKEHTLRIMAPRIGVVSTRNVWTRCSLSVGLKKEFKSKNLFMKIFSSTKSIVWMQLRAVPVRDIHLIHRDREQWVRARNNILLTSFCFKQKCMLHVLKPFVVIWNSLYRHYCQCPPGCRHNNNSRPFLLSSLVLTSSSNTRTSTSCNPK